MSTELKVPEVGESVVEVEIGQWLVKEGQEVAKDQPLVEIETDKVTVELPAPEAGKLERIIKQTGQKVHVGEVIGQLQAPGKAPAGAAPPAPAQAAPREVETQRQSQQAAPPPTTEAKAPQAQVPDAPPATAPTTQLRPSAAPRFHEAPAPPASPAAAPAAGEAEQQPELIAPAEPLPPEPPAAPQRPPAATPAPFAAETVTELPAPSAEARQEEVVPLSPLRRRVARRLVEAQHNAALLTTFNEVDMSAIAALRKQHQEAFQARHQIKLGLMSFFVRASVQALLEFPQINAQLRGQEVVYHSYCDLGIAVATEKGLVVPVLRNAEKMSLAQIERAIHQFAQQARDNKLQLRDLEGGTFTISNGGVYGSLLSTPIVNPPQSAILGLHTIQERPIAVAGNVVIRPMMYLALTYDHRIIDGKEAVSFLRRVKELVEEPLRLLLEI